MRSSRRASKQARPVDPAVQAREAAFAEVRAHELFGPMLKRIQPDDVDGWGVRSSALRRDGLLAVDAHGGLVFNGRARAATAEWTWSLAHALTHLGLGHADPARRDGRGSYAAEWRAACCLAVNRFLGTIGIPGAPDVPAGFEDDEEALATRFAARGIPALRAVAGPAGSGPDLWENLHESRQAAPAEAASVWARTFATGLTAFDGAAATMGQNGRRLELPAAARALEAAAAPWAERFNAWFDERFPMLQSSLLELAGAARDASAGAPAPSASFGMVVDTSGSMDRALLGRALDAVAASAAARDVRRARVVVCDASPRDAGWLPPEEVAGLLDLRDRRGAFLQPGIDLLEADRSFAPDEPIVLIAGGRCDHVRVPRDHAWLTSGDLSFAPEGPVFRLA